MAKPGNLGKLGKWESPRRRADAATGLPAETRMDIDFPTFPTFPDFPIFYKFPCLQGRQKEHCTSACADVYSVRCPTLRSLQIYRVIAGLIRRSKLQICILKKH